VCVGTGERSNFDPPLGLMAAQIAAFIRIDVPALLAATT
jgi:hypothetical protein